MLLSSFWGYALAGPSNREPAKTLANLPVAAAPRQNQTRLQPAAALHLTKLTAETPALTQKCTKQTLRLGALGVRPPVHNRQRCETAGPLRCPLTNVALAVQALSWPQCSAVLGAPPPCSGEAKHQTANRHWWGPCLPVQVSIQTRRQDLVVLF